MNNLIIEKSIHDETMIRLEVIVESEYVIAKQYCYVDIIILTEMSTLIDQFVNTLEPTYIEVGSKIGNYTPAFSINIETIDSLGHLRLEMDLEIDDNKERIHRCQTYIYCNIGELIKFRQKLINLSNIDYYDVIKLIE